MSVLDRLHEEIERLQVENARLAKALDEEEQARRRQVQAVCAGLHDRHAPDPQVLLWTPEGIRRRAFEMVAHEMAARR